MKYLLTFTSANIWFILILMSTMSVSVQAQPTQTEKFPTEFGPLHITPILHATMVIEWNGKTIYIDPYGGAERFQKFAAPDMVIITHAHGDHLNPTTLKELDLAKTELIAPQSVVEEAKEQGIMFETVTTLENGVELERSKVKVMAVPMYNLPDDETSRHKPGWGNGYVLTIGGKRIYISGDTEDIPEMRSLKEIDIAFVCMNLPYTMTVEQAASAVLDFAPKMVYPFHYRGAGRKFSDVEAFRTLVEAKNEEIEVRLRNWYPEY